MLSILILYFFLIEYAVNILNISEIYCDCLLFYSLKVI